jgi:hypothetical protein
MSNGKDRRAKLLAQSPATLNGIDYVVVGDETKATLEVHFMTDASVAGTTTAVGITGGASIPSVPVRSMRWSTKSDHRPLLTLHLAMTGDSSIYTLSLASPVLDPFFSDFQFSFTAGEPSMLDCEAPTIPAAPAPSALPPPIDYLSKDFLSFRKALSDFSALRYPAWQERSDADFGVMFLEALSGLGDDLSYQQDRVSAEAYLATATERVSVVRHARLVNYEPQPALAASVTLQFTVNTGTTSIPPGLAVSATGPDGTAIDFETGTALADTQRYLETPADYLASTTQYRANSKWNEMRPYWWDESNRTLNVGATEMWVRSHGLGLAQGIVLLLETTPALIELPNIREGVQIESVDQQHDQLYDVEVTHIVFQSPLGQEHDLRATTVKGNLIPATQGLRHVEAFAIGSGVPGTPPAIERTGPNGTILYLYTLGNAPLTWLAAASGVSPAWVPEIVVVQPQSTPTGPPQVWTWCQSILDAGAFAAAFTIEPLRYTLLPAELADGVIQYDYDGSDGDTLRFGDGSFGEVPDPGSIFTVTYRAGAGTNGNVAADSITAFDPTGPVAQLASAVTNPFAATGGSDLQSLDSVRRFAPYAFQSGRVNAVVATDYANVAQRLPWVQHAGTTFRYTGSWLTAFTTVEPAVGENPSTQQTLGLIGLLDRSRMAGFQSDVLSPDYVSLDLQINATALPSAFDTVVAAAILQTLGTGTLPNGSPEFFAQGQLTFGEPLERSALEAAIQKVNGVAGVTSIRYRRSGAVRPLVEMSERICVAMNQIIRVDNDPTQPEAGSIAVVVTGGK